MLPKAVYFPILTLYLTLKKESGKPFDEGGQQSTNPRPIMHVNPQSLRCSQVMHVQREIYPKISSAL